MNDHIEGARLIGLSQGLMIAPLRFELLAVELVANGHIGGPYRGNDHLYLVLDARVLDRDDAQPRTIRFAKSILKTAVDSVPDYLHEMLREALREMMSHEIDELLLRDGVRISEPHK